MLCDTHAQEMDHSGQEMLQSVCPKCILAYGS